MSIPAQPTPKETRFDSDDLVTLAKTADALCAYLGKPVLAEIGQSDTGYEWVTFGVPVPHNSTEDSSEVRVQLGGPNARLVGTRGGLLSADTEVYDCLYLWAVQITADAQERFVKLDGEGEESAWSDRLADVLPFGLADEDEDEEDDLSDETRSVDDFAGIDYSRRH